MKPGVEIVWVRLLSIVWVRVSDPDRPRSAAGFVDSLSHGQVGRVQLWLDCRASLGLDGSETRPYTGLLGEYFEQC